MGSEKETKKFFAKIDPKMAYIGPTQGGGGGTFGQQKLRNGNTSAKTNVTYPPTCGVRGVHTAI